MKNDSYIMLVAKAVLMAFLLTLLCIYNQLMDLQNIFEIYDLRTECINQRTPNDSMNSNLAEL